jgi:hypothetical protein
MLGLVLDLVLDLCRGLGLMQNKELVLFLPMFSVLGLVLSSWSWLYGLVRVGLVLCSFCSWSFGLVLVLVLVVVLVLVL